MASPPTPGRIESPTNSSTREIYHQSTVFEPLLAFDQTAQRTWITSIDEASITPQQDLRRRSQSLCRFQASPAPVLPNQ
jgi:hypothetical protein